MKTLTSEAIEAIETLSDLEKKCCLNMVDRLKHLGMHHHASAAVCSLAAASALPMKK